MRFTLDKCIPVWSEEPKLFSCMWKIFIDNIFFLNKLHTVSLNIKEGKHAPSTTVTVSGFLLVFRPPAFMHMCDVYSCHDSVKAAVNFISTTWTETDKKLEELLACTEPYWKRKWQPTLVFLPGKSHRQRSLAGYSPRGHKELDTT